MTSQRPLSTRRRETLTCCISDPVIECVRAAEIIVQRVKEVGEARKIIANG